MWTRTSLGGNWIVLFAIGVVGCAGWSGGARASVPARTPPPALKPGEKDSLRQKLDRLYYDRKLLIANHAADVSSVAHQEREFQSLRVFERIPLREDLSGLRSSLEDSSRDRSLKLISFKALPRERKAPQAPPSTLYSDENPGFRLQEAQLAEEIPFEVVVSGDPRVARAWARAWPEDQLRLAQPIGELTAAGPDRWRMRGRAFRFREVKFPSLEPRDPFEVLPAWARKDSERFARVEPVLWEIAVRARELAGPARPLYRTRERVLLNDARMSFFVARAVASK